MKLSPPTARELAQLARKYADIAALRRARDRGESIPEKDVFGELATQFPAALRELDTLPLETVDARRDALDVAVVVAEIEAEVIVGSDALVGQHDMGLAQPHDRIDVAAARAPALSINASGADALERFAHDNRAVAAASPAGHLFSLAMLGVRRSHQGHGVGTRLVQWANASCDADPRAAGLIADTGNERLGGLFTRHGYREIAQVAVNAELRQSVLFRPRASHLA